MEKMNIRKKKVIVEEIILLIIGISVMVIVGYFVGPILGILMGILPFSLFWFNLFVELFDWLSNLNFVSDIKNTQITFKKI